MNKTVYKTINELSRADKSSSLRLLTIFGRVNYVMLLLNSDQRNCAIKKNEKMKKIIALRRKKREEAEEDDKKRKEKELKEKDYLKELAKLAKNESKLCFHCYDITGKEEINFHQVKSAFKEFNIDITDTDCKEIVATFDKSDTGRITMEDFQREMHDEIVNGTRDVHVKMVFDFIDQNSDGIIDEDEMMKLYECFAHFTSEEEVCEDCNDVGKTGQGFIDYRDFQTLCYEIDQIKVLGDDFRRNMEDP